ncbi:toxin-antitoxin system antitoxin component family protein [Magnetospirillum sp. ME-1]|nr:toxin-antitoxin system antitoxin component family protein [Magnetospirillum sp. ME-1]
MPGAGYDGPWSSYASHAHDKHSLIDVIRVGFPIGTIQNLIDSGRLSMVEIDRVVLPRKTLANRKKIGTLTAEQSDRLLRVARVIAAAEETFGSPQKADIWLRRPSAALDDEAPLDLLDTEEGAREVESLLTRIAHGISA